MLYVALVFSLTILVAVCAIGYWSSAPWPTGTIPLVLGLMPNCGMTILPPVLIQCLLTLVGLYILFSLLPIDRARRVFVVYAVIAALVAWGVALRMAYFQMKTHDRLRDELKYEPIRDRLPTPEPATSPPTDTHVLAAVESQTDDDWVSKHRADQLRLLHEDRVRLFVNSPGFGVIRMPLTPSEEYLKRWRGGEDPVPQPGPTTPKPPTGGTPELFDLTLDQPDLRQMHANAIVDFAFPGSNGLRRADGQVAGFQPHGLTGTPSLVDPWRVERVDLIGLLLASEPRVYVSEFLPRMDELKDAATRPPDEFEATALSSLRAGKELVVHDTETGNARAVGAIRAAKQCLDCHGGNRGDLLGAFSYTFGR